MEEPKIEVKIQKLKMDAKEKEALERLKKKLPKEIKLTVEVGNVPFFNDEEIKREYIQFLESKLEEEKRKCLKEVCNLKDLFKGKNLKEIFRNLISFPLDYYTFSHYFNLLKQFSKDVILLADSNLEKEKFNFLLNRLKEEAQELRFLDKFICEYCQLDFSYYQEIVNFFQRKFLYYGEDEKINQIVFKIKEVI